MGMSYEQLEESLAKTAKNLVEAEDEITRLRQRMATTAQIVEAGARVERLLDGGCMNADTILAAVLTALEIPLITPHN